MTKKELEIIKQVYKKLDHVLYWDNKNLKKAQMWDLSDCLDLLEKIGGKR